MQLKRGPPVSVVHMAVRCGARRVVDCESGAAASCVPLAATPDGELTRQKKAFRPGPQAEESDTTMRCARTPAKPCTIDELS